MKALIRLLNRSPRQELGDPPPEAASPTDEEAPIRGYDRLDERDVSAQLHELSQVELAAVDSYERSHKNRPAVLAKLRYMRTEEPLPGYDGLSTEGVQKELAGADAETVKAVRDYERKFARRPQVLKEAARGLPTSPASAKEDRAEQRRNERVREGFAGRARTADDLADRRAAPPTAD